MYYSALGYISILSQLIIIFIGLYTYRNLTFEFKFFLIIASLGFIVDSLSYWQYFSSRISPLFYQFYVPLEFCCIMFIISQWQKSKKTKQFFYILIFGYIVFWLSSKLYLESLFSYSYLTSTVATGIIVLSAGYTLFIVVSNKTETLKRMPAFWFLIAFIIYYSGILLPTSLQMLFSSFPKNDFYILWSLNWIFNILSNILYAIGFLCHLKRT